MPAKSKCKDHKPLMSLSKQGLQRSLKEMLDPKFTANKAHIMQVYKTLKGIEKFLEVEVGVAYAESPFPLKTTKFLQKAKMNSRLRPYRT